MHEVFSVSINKNTIQKISFSSLEDELSRNSRYINENVDLHVHKSQIENSYRTLKEQFELNERDKFELQEQLISLEQLLQSARDERDQYALKYHSQEEEIQKYVLEQSKNSIMYEEKCHQLQQAIKQVSEHKVHRIFTLELSSCRINH